MKTLKIFLAITLLTIVGFSQSKVGTTAANFLTIPIGSKAAGMGGAFVAQTNDATALYWNPGGISRLVKSEFGISYSEWLVGTKFNWIGLAFKTDDDNAFGLSINQLDYGDEEITTPEKPNGTGERWKAQDICFALTYARNLTDRFSIGGSLKYIRQQIWNESASAFAMDIGLLFNTQLEGLRIGMNIANFGTEMKLDGKDLLQPVDIDPANTGNNDKITSTLNTDTWTLPLNFTVGLGYDVYRDNDLGAVIAIDAVIPNNQNTFVRIGTELFWNDIVFFRTGYNSLNTLYPSEKDGTFDVKLTEETFSLGAGIQYDFGPFYSKVDYSYTDFGIFNSISRISVTIGF
jgi:hypothetical protein